MTLNINEEIQKFDLLVIGWGTAGHLIAKECSQNGLSVAIVEGNPERYGGSSINEACVPTKTLVYSVRNFRSSAVLNDGLAGWNRATDQARAISTSLREQAYQTLTQAGVKIFNGWAEFTDERTVCVVADAYHEKIHLRGEKVVINTGSKPNLPSIKGIDNPRVLDSAQIQTIQERPCVLTIVGAGKIGLEFASIFASLGTVVTVVDQAEQPLPDFDEEVTKEVLRTLEKAGVHFVNSARVVAFAQNISGIVSLVKTQDEEGTKPLVSNYVLLAMGRKPQTSGLNLQETGVNTEEDGTITVDDELKTSANNIWAVGDCKTGPHYTSVAIEDALTVLHQLLPQTFKNQSCPLEDRIIPTCTFLDPALAQVGLSEKAARVNHEVTIKSAYVKDLENTPQALIRNQNDGMIKFIIDAKTDQILGATLFCVNAHELINLVTTAMRCHITATQLAQGIYIHPSMAEAFKSVLNS